MPWSRREFKHDSGAQIPVVVQIDLDHAMIHDGTGFTYSNLHSAITSSATSDHLIVTGDEEAHLRQLSFETSGSPVLLQYYEDTITSADGTSAPLGNNNRTSTKTTGTTLYVNPTVTTIGNQMGATLIPSITNQGGGVGILAGGEWILKPNTKHLIRLTNNDNAAIDYVITMFFVDPSLTGT